MLIVSRRRAGDIGDEWYTENILTLCPLRCGRIDPQRPLANYGERSECQLTVEFEVYWIVVEVMMIRMTLCLMFRRFEVINNILYYNAYAKYSRN